MSNSRHNTPAAVPVDLNSDDARKKVDRVKALVADAWTEIVDLYRGRAWIALGYPTWDELCSAEFAGARLRLPREERRDLVGSLREAGLSTRAIASAVGIDHSTVVRDLPSTGANAPVDRVVSLDGRSRPAGRPAAGDPPAEAVVRPLRAEPVTAPAEPPPTPTEAAVAQATEDRPIADPALREWVDSDPDLQNSAYMKAFLGALVAAGKLPLFDPHRVGQLATDDEAVSIRHLAASVQDFLTRFERARHTLRVVDGGAR